MTVHDDAPDIRTLEPSEDWTDDPKYRACRSLLVIFLLWACFWLIRMAYSIYLWHGEEPSTLRFEGVISGCAEAGFLGLPAWLGIPFLSWALQGKLSRRTLYLINVPVVLAALLFMVLYVLAHLSY